MTFEKLNLIIDKLASIDGVDVETIGASVSGKPIRAYHIGNYDDNQIIITAAIHAREWITALLTVELVKLYAPTCRGGVPPPAGGIYFIPLCNPDGVQIALDSSPLWKANGRGVDLNVNFDADWGTGAQNVRIAGSENYIGPKPNSEPEVQALVDFTLRINPKATIAYHSKGEEIYYGFEPKGIVIPKSQLKRDARLARKLGRITGYKAIKTKNSAGGYTDWVSMHLGVPAFTLEVGNDRYDHPIGVEHLPKIFKQNRKVPRFLLKRN